MNEDPLRDDPVSVDVAEFLKSETEESIEIPSQSNGIDVDIDIENNNNNNNNGSENELSDFDIDLNNENSNINNRLADFDIEINNNSNNNNSNSNSNAIAEWERCAKEVLKEAAAELRQRHKPHRIYIKPQKREIDDDNSSNDDNNNNNPTPTPIRNRIFNPNPKTSPSPSPTIQPTQSPTFSINFTLTPKDHNLLYDKYPFSFDNDQLVVEEDKLISQSVAHAGLPSNGDSNYNNNINIDSIVEDSDNGSENDVNVVSVNNNSNSSSDNSRENSLEVPWLDGGRPGVEIHNVPDSNNNSDIPIPKVICKTTISDKGGSYHSYTPQFRLWMGLVWNQIKDGM